MMGGGRVVMRVLFGCSETPCAQPLLENRAVLSQRGEERIDSSLISAAANSSMLPVWFDA